MKTLAARALMALALVCAALSVRADSRTVWLVLAIDASNSINNAEWRLQKDSYVKVLVDPALAPWLQKQKVHVAILEFGYTATLVVPFSSAEEASAAYALAGRASSGETNVRAALELALELLAHREGEKIIDISGDGANHAPLAPIFNESCRSIADAIERAREKKVAVNALAILGEPAKCGATADRWYQYAIGKQGFVMVAKDFYDFRDALARKVRREIEVALISR